MQGRVVASEEFVHDAIQAKDTLNKDFFGPSMSGRVKRTELTYHIIQDHSFIKTANLLTSIPRGKLKAEPMHVLVFDLVKYSERNELLQRTMVETLAEAVRQSHAWLGRGPITLDTQIQYAPAGDGGAVIFANDLARCAWIVAEHLQEYSRIHKLALRLGLDSGQMVRREEGVPIGPGVLGADRAAQSAEEGVICFTKRFLYHVPEEDRSYINARTNIHLIDELKTTQLPVSPPSIDPQTLIDTFCKELTNFLQKESGRSGESKIGKKISVLVLHGSGFPNLIRDSILKCLRDSEIDCICPSLNAKPYSYTSNIENAIPAVTHVLYLASRGENIHKGWATHAKLITRVNNKIWVPRIIDFQL